MRTITTTILTLFVSLQMLAGKVIKNPEIEYSAPWMVITEIEVTKDATIIRATLKPYSSILNNTVLADRNTGKEYKFLRVEGIKPQERYEVETPCAVYFEPLDANVKEFNYIEVGNNPFGNYYGIKLQPKKKVSKKAKGFDPGSLNYDYYMTLPFTPDNEWKFSNEPYKDGFNSGKAQLKIHVANVPKELSGVLPDASAKVTNQITRQEENYVTSKDESNSYTLNLNIPHPQFVYVQPFGNVFLAPGDTLEMFSTIETDPDSREPRFKTFRGNSESAMINTLLPKFVEKYGSREYKYNEVKAVVESGKDATQALLVRLANQTNEIVASEELRQALINSPLSTYGKDLVMVSVLANKCIEIEDVIGNYTHNKYIQTQQEDGNWKLEQNPDYVELDLSAVYNTLLKNKELIYDNPLAISESNQWVFVNRTLFGPLLFSWETVKVDENHYSQRRRDDYGMTGTFINDIRLSQDVTWRLKETLKSDKLGQLEGNRDIVLDYMPDYVGESLAGIKNVKVAQAIVGEYRKFVKATDMGAADSGNNWTAAQKALWNKIVSPYKGNTLYIDFWGMGCGPCRAGMLNQRKLVEEMKDEKIKFLYITTDDQKTSAEKWMDENSIKGEHVYITNNEWKQFETMINFTAIPRGALVNKEGKLIESDFHIGKAEELKKLVDRF